MRGRSGARASRERRRSPSTPDDRSTGASAPELGQRRGRRAGRGSPCGVPNSTRWTPASISASRLRRDLAPASPRRELLERRLWPAAARASGRARRRRRGTARTSAARARARSVAVLVDDGDGADDDARPVGAEPLAHQPHHVGVRGAADLHLVGDGRRERRGARAPGADHQRHGRAQRLVREPGAGREREALAGEAARVAAQAGGGRPRPPRADASAASPRRGRAGRARRR